MEFERKEKKVTEDKMAQDINALAVHAALLVKRFPLLGWVASTGDDGERKRKPLTFSILHTEQNSNLSFI
jgi:hypothetical protein